MKLILLSTLALISQLLLAQPIQLFEQYNGNYDFTAFGNTLNTGPNSCNILTQSDADFSMPATGTVVTAVLYWAGVGSGDFDVELNGQAVTAQRDFGINISGFDYFAAFADVTEIINTFGDATYTLSELDLTAVIGPYCSQSTDFGGWSVIAIYEDDALPFNDIRIYDGFVALFAANPTVSFTLAEPVIYDTTTATLGFLAWEGDSGLAVGENLIVNGALASGPPLNPSDNIFNGTNTFTGSSDLWNMDLDSFDISDLINETDDFIQVEISSLQDVIMMNTIITKVEDATATDTDNDLVFDAQEDLNVNRILADDNTDGDSLANYLDDDDDGDGTPTRDEDYNNNGTPIDDDTNGNNIPDYLDDEVFLGVKEFEISNINIIPNPVRDQILIEVSNALNKNYLVKVVSVTGKTVIDFGKLAVQNKLSLNVASLNEGLYFLTFQDGNNTSTKKFIKL